MADKLRKIVSGGQTGVDRAALDWALARGVPCGGWCPLGRWAEDGSIDAWYPLRETPDADPAQRTEWNVRDSDGTLIVTLARRLAKPLLHLAKADSPAAGQAESLSQFIGQHEIRVLNVAGPRESGEPGVGEFAAVLLEAALGQPDEA